MRAGWKVGIAALALAATVVAIALGPFAPTIAFLSDLTGEAGGLRRLIPIRPYAVATEDLEVSTRHGGVPARLYFTTPWSRATVLVVPGVHGGGLDEPRQARFSARLAATGLTVLTLPLPDLRAFRLTARSTDQIEDAIGWLTSNSRLAPRGRVGLIGVSFAGGLAVVAAGRPAIADRIDLVLSLGGHGDLPRALRYLCTGRLPDGTARPPHDYGLAVLAIQAVPWIVPPAQATALERGIRTYLEAALDTSAEQAEASRLLAVARDEASRLPEPAHAIMTAINLHDVAALGRVLEPSIDQVAADPALSPERSPRPRAPVFLLHGTEDNVIPSSETELLAADLGRRGHPRVRALLTPVISHVGIQSDAGLGDYWRLVTFWRALRAALEEENH